MVRHRITPTLLDNPGATRLCDLLNVVDYLDELHHPETTLDHFIEQARRSPLNSAMGHAWNYLHTLANHIASSPLGRPYGPRLDELGAADWYRKLGLALTPTERISNPLNTYALPVLEQAAGTTSQPIARMPHTLEIHAQNVHVAITRTEFDDYVIDAITPSKGPDADQFWLNLQDSQAANPGAVRIYH